MPEAEPAPTSRASFKVDAKAVAVASAAITIAALVTLVIVSTEKTTNVLSETALALAVFAFIAGLVIALAQLIAAHNQERSTAEAIGRSEVALGEVKSSMHDLVDNFRSHNELILRTAIERAIPDAVAETQLDQSNPSDFEKRLSERAVILAQRGYDHLTTQQRYLPNDRIRHPKWGMATVLSVNESNMLTVQFPPPVGVRTLDPYLAGVVRVPEERSEDTQ